MENSIGKLCLMEQTYPCGRPATNWRADDIDRTFEEDRRVADQSVHHYPQYCRSRGCILNDNIPSENPGAWELSWSASYGCQSSRNTRPSKGSKGYTTQKYVHHDPQYCPSCGRILNDNIPSENHRHPTNFNAIPVNPSRQTIQEFIYEDRELSRCATCGYISSRNRRPSRESKVYTTEKQKDWHSAQLRQLAAFPTLRNNHPRQLRRSF